MGLLQLLHKNHTLSISAPAVMLLLLLSGIVGSRRGVASAFRALSSVQHPICARQSQKFPSTSSSSSTTRRFFASRSTRHLSFAAASSSAAETTFTQQQTQGGSNSSVLQIPKKFISYPFEYHREITLTIDTLTNLGMGIARVKLSNVLEEEQIDATKTPDKDAMWVVMIPNVIPGEVVTGRIFRNHKSYSEADLVGVLEPSPDRVEPKCPLASECGGCQYQHMPIGLQREWKTKHVAECFQQQKVDLENEHQGVQVQPAMGTEHDYSYRSKITPHYQAPPGNRSRRRGRQRAIERKEKYIESNEPLPSVDAIGFQRATVRSIVDVPSCPIATEPVNAAYQKVRQDLLHLPYQGDLGATLLFRQANICDDTIVSNHNEYMTTNVNGLAFTYLAGNFFQNNLYILPEMVNTVMEKAAPSYSKDGEEIEMTHFVDCYCGSGLFCLSAAQHFETCVGIEINAKAILEAQNNAEANDLSHKCSFEASRAEAIFDNPQVQTFPRDTTVVMLDPPRKGCDETFLKQLESFRPKRIVYLSCNPATQARDVKEMISWGYTITFVQPFDLFPQTRHIESLAVLERND